MSKLVVVESPAKAKTIGKYLGRDFHVVASIGHVRDLPKSNKHAIDLEHGFKPHYEISPGKEKVVAEISRLAKKASEVLLATDPDREGEAIAWHLKEACKLDSPKRVVFHEITESAIKEAIDHPRNIDNKLRHAQEARRVLDRLFGYDLSGLIWKKLRYGLSAGRVQSPALRILAEREREILAFIPEKFWVIEGDFKTKAGDIIKMTYAIEPKTEEETKRVVSAAKSAKWQVGDVTEDKAKRAPRAPFTTSTLQQAASSRLGYSPSVTMRLAQRLYEAGHITYMRTDSTNLSGQALGDIGRVVETKFGNNYYHGPRQYATRSKNAQEAHEAIRPTSASKTSVGAGPEAKLYELIWKRAVASQMVEAEILKTKVTAQVDPSTELGASKSLEVFAANGQRITFDGWLKADPAARNEEVELPKVQAGEPLTLADLRDLAKETQPPNRYSEAGLVKELEKRGIGRPSTYAAIMKTIIDRGYVAKIDRSLQPTDLGMVVSGFLETNFADYISDTFTAKMEDELDEIARGERDYEGTLKEFYGPFTKAVASKAKIEKINNLGEADPSIKCPVCDGPMVIKLAKNGKFLSCAKFPKCKGARTEDGKELEGPKPTGEKCPDCEGDLIEREGRFGKFIACANYPKCKFVKQDPAAEAARDTGVQCPLCKKGTMREKRGRFGIFYSCSNYPACKNAIKAKPTGTLCPMCNSLMMEGTKTIPERCSNKGCPNHNPHKLEKKS